MGQARHLKIVRAGLCLWLSPLWIGCAETSLDSALPDNGDVSLDTSPTLEDAASKDEVSTPLHQLHDGGGSDVPAAPAPADGGNGSESTDSLGSSTADSTTKQGPTRYPATTVHSPITAHVLDAWHAVSAQNPNALDDRFMKVGDSITASAHFLNCFAATNLSWGTHHALQPTRDHFSANPISAVSCFARKSQSVKGGRNTKWALSGSPSPLQKERLALNPRFAVVMFGTNDVGYYGDDHIKGFKSLSDNMSTLLDELISHGVLPMLMTIPPRTKKPNLQRWTASVNLLLRGLAQQRQIPLVDYHLSLQSLPNKGISSDGVHPNAHAPAGKKKACALDTAALAHGYNMRNLVTLQALDRLKRTLLDNQEPSDKFVAGPPGAGTIADPFSITALPWLDHRDTSIAPSDTIDSYPGCKAKQDESGAEVIYRMTLTEKTALRAMVLDWGAADLDVHLLGNTANGANCIKRSDTIIEGTLPAGTYHWSIDTFVSNAQIKAGKYIFFVVPCDGTDQRCKLLLP